MKNEKPIAVIPAKGGSERIPGKNMAMLRGHQLFLYSVWYAINEGFTPVVSSDDQNVLECASYYGASTFLEKVDDSDMANCVKQIFGSKAYSHADGVFALLQPTSPLRSPGLLREMASRLEETGAGCAFTAKRVKMLGTMIHMDSSGVPKKNKFYMAYRDQDADRLFMAHNGNILVRSRKGFDATGCLFDGDKSEVYDSSFEPCTNLQVDRDGELQMIDGIMSNYWFDRFNPKNHLSDEYKAKHFM